MRRLLKFLHTIGAAGLMGAAAALAIVLMLAPASNTSAYAPFVAIMAKIAAWLIGPSMVLTILTGLLAMLATRAFQDAGWVWVKAATGILILLATIHVLGPIQEEAKRNADVIGDPTSGARLFESEINTLWVLLAISAANVALGVWRPRLPKYKV